MQDKTSKIISYVLYGLIGISVLLTFVFYFDLVSVDTMLFWTYTLLAVGSVAPIVFMIMLLVQDPKRIKGILISTAGLLIVLGIGYVMASGEVLDSYEKYDVDAGTSKMVGMAIIATYTLMLISTVGIFFFAIMQAIKK